MYRPCSEMTEQCEQRVHFLRPAPTPTPSAGTSRQQDSGSRTPQLSALPSESRVFARTRLVPWICDVSILP